MKKTLAAIITVAGLAAAGTIYPETCIITECNEQKDLVTMETCIGHIFEFEGIEDYSRGDLVSCIMFDNFTPDDVRDDIIISTRYAGYTELFNKAVK